VRNDDALRLAFAHGHLKVVKYLRKRISSC